MKIVVDLDGTLIQSDSSFSIWQRSWKKNFFMSVQATFLYLIKGEARAKDYIKTSEKINYKLNEKLVSYLKKLNKKNGFHLILATGANMKVAQEFNAQHRLFKDIIASCSEINCIGIHKLKAIRKLIGNHEFMYIGDAWYDCPVWEEAAVIGVMNPNKQLFAFLKKLAHRKKSRLIKFDKN